MPRDWELQFIAWAKPPGQAEQSRSDNAISAIENAINASPRLNNRDVSIFSQGSYRNNTNVKKDSDVDVGILCKDTFYHQLHEDLTEDMFNFTPTTYLYEQYKNEVEEALVSYFGRSSVERGNKAINVQETSYHVEADVAAFFEHRRYEADRTFISGVELRTDRENLNIINWPEQHYSNGVKKNNQTGRRFKAIVRILKALSNEMADSKVRGGNIPGFLIECLTWNVPNDRFQNSTYSDDVKGAIAFLAVNTGADDLCEEWGEVSELKYLFKGPQSWTRKQANDFLLAAWQYVGIWSSQ